jgi:hypothetical protein
MKHLKATAPLPLLLLALIKCSGDAQGGSGEINSGISSSKALSALTAQEAASGCEHMNDAVEAHFNRSSAKTGLCTLLGLALSPDESSCVSQRDACLKSESGDSASSSPADEFECSDASVEGWQGCSATVGDLEACLNDMLGAFDTLLSSYSCKDAGKATYTEDCSPPPLTDDGKVAIDPVTGKPYVDHRFECEAANLASPTPPKSCQALQNKCPELDMFGGGVDDSPTN